MIVWNQTAEQIASTLEKIRADYKDFVVDPKRLDILLRDEQHAEHLWRETDLNPSPITGTGTISSPAFSQLLARLGIPGNFFKKCPLTIQESLVKHFLSKRKRNFFVRTAKVPGGFMARAFLTTRYSTDMDNHLVFPAVFQALEGKNAEYTIFELSDYAVRLHAFFTDATAELNGVNVQAGVVITNSETGQSKLWIDPVIIVKRPNEPIQVLSARLGEYEEATGVGFVHTRSGTITAEEVLESVKKIKDVAQVGIVQYLEAMDKPVENAKKALDEMKSLPKRIVSVVEEAVNALPPGVKAWKLIHFILQATRELPLVQRIAIENDCTKFLGVFRDTEARMTKLAAELEELS